MDYSLTNFKVQVVRQGSMYIAYSHELDVSTTGKSEDQALENINDLIRISVHSFIKNEQKRPGLMHRKLFELGWTNKLKRWSPPVVEEE